MQTPVPPETLTGLLERVTFFNEENGFAVLKVKVQGRREEVTIVGSLPSANPGEWVTAEGRWVREREFGLQFKRMTCDPVRPSRDGIESISHGLVKGIDGPGMPKTARGALGEKTSTSSKHCSARAGSGRIGPTARRHQSGVGRATVIREIMVSFFIRRRIPPGGADLPHVRRERHRAGAPNPSPPRALPAAAQPRTVCP